MSKITFSTKTRFFTNARTFRDKLVRRWISDTNTISERLENYIILRHLTGGTSDTRLAVRSGTLRRSVSALRAKLKGDRIEGGINIGAKYAGTHIARTPKVTVIKPTRTKYLSIPLQAALTDAGVNRQISPLDYPDLFVLGRGRRTPLLVRKDGSGGIIPMFALVKQVKIKSRVHTKDILEKFKAPYIALLSKSFREVFS